MRCVTGILLTFLLSMAGIDTARAAPCANDFKSRVAANGECLAIGVYGKTAAQNTLIVFVHGDGSGPNTNQSERISNAAYSFGTKGVISVTLTRPGYCGPNGCSSGSRPDYSDSYSPSSPCLGPKRRCCSGVSRPEVRRQKRADTLAFHPLGQPTSGART